MNKKEIRYYHNLLGRLELERENYSGAIELLNKALRDVPFQNFLSSDHALFIEPLAAAYFRSGAFGKAAEEYGKLISLTVGRIYLGDIYAKSFYMLGRIAEQTGDKVKSCANYQKFLDLWKEADPGLPEVDDARKRLAGLKGT
jgi:tetratricopeptide (TPR) repeat protein